MMIMVNDSVVDEKIIFLNYKCMFSLLEILETIVMHIVSKQLFVSYLLTVAL